MRKILQGFNVFGLGFLSAFAGWFFLAMSVAGSAQVVAWGSNDAGQLDIPAEATNVIWVAAGSRHCLALRADQTVVAWGDNTNGQCSIPASATNVVAIAAGAEYSLALRGDGTLLAWGRNTSGQTNAPVSATNIVAIAAGDNHVLAMRGDGSISAWGSTGMGRVDGPLQSQRVVGIAAGFPGSLIMKADGSVQGWGQSINPLPNSATNALLLAVSSSRFSVLRADGTIAEWGNNITIGVPSEATNLVHVAMRSSLTIAARQDGSVFAWGAGTNVTNMPVFLTNAVAVGAGLNFAVALVGEGPPRVLDLVRSFSIQAGRGFFIAPNVVGALPFHYQWMQNGNPIDGATNRVFASSCPTLDAAGDYSLAVSNSLGASTGSVAQVTVTDNPVICWGSNRALECEVPASASNITAVAAGVNHAVAVREDGTVVVWGSVDPFNQSMPASVFPTNVPPAATNVTAVAAGGYYCLALRRDGSIVAWGGFNNAGETTIPVNATNVTAIAAGESHNLALRSNGTVVAWGSGVSGKTVVPASATNVAAIAAGVHHSLALRSNGNVFAWGGQTATVTTVPVSATNIIAIAAGENFSLALRSNGTVLAWGSNSYGQLDIPPDVTNIVSVSAKSRHALALRADGTVLAWGANVYNQLNVPPVATNVVAIAAGSTFSMALRNEALLLLANLADQEVSAGSELAFSALVSGKAPLAYQWQFNGTDINGATNASLPLSGVNWPQVGTYRIVVSNSFGAVTSPEARLAVTGMPILFDVAASRFEPTNSSFSLKLVGLSGAKPVVLYGSTNLADWIPAITNPPGLGWLQFNDTSAVIEDKRYYRAVEQP